MSSARVAAAFELAKSCGCNISVEFEAMGWTLDVSADGSFVLHLPGTSKCTTWSGLRERLQELDSPARRGQRKRFSPLAFWKGESVIYAEGEIAGVKSSSS